MSRVVALHERLRPLKSALVEHELYRHVGSLPALRLFMEHHVFAVWDFMSLLKALQRRLCCVEVPWLPPEFPLACRLVNEVVVGEESDEDGRGGYCSHFELYRGAMARCGASTAAVDRFLGGLRRRKSVPDSLTSADAPTAAREFVMRTFAVLERGEPWAIASAFTFGREELLPELFRRVVRGLDAEAGGVLGEFRYYLDRHIGLDEGEHGPAAERLVALLCGDDESRWRAAEQAAIDSLKARQALWDGVLTAVRGMA